MTQDAAPRGWHVERGVNLAFVATILAQTAYMGWWASAVSAEIAHHERRIVALEQRDERLDADLKRTADLLVRLDERSAAQTELLRRLDNMLRNRAP
jgi:Tfp pilus assembly protein PilN